MKYRIVNRTRFTIFVVLMILIMVLIGSLILNICQANASEETNVIEIQVSYGDTLWQIAKTYMPESSDINRSVYQICKLNGITASELYAGMTIQVPINN